MRESCEEEVEEKAHDWFLHDTVGSVDLVIMLCSRFDADLAPSFSDMVKGLIKEGSRLILLDLERVEFIDSTALGGMVQCLKRLRRTEGGDLVLCGVQDKVMSLFALTRMDRVFTIFPDRASALRVLEEQP